MKLRSDIHKIGWMIFGIVLAGFLLQAWQPKKSNNIFALMMVLVGIVSFYGAIGLGVGVKDSNLSKTDIRLAITVSIISFYLVLVGTTSFFVNDRALPDITNTLITHFTNIVGVVIVFYFGTVAYETVHKPATTKTEGNEVGTDNSS